MVKQGGTVLMAAMYDGDNNRVFELDNTYKWEDCYGDEVLIPENQRTEDGDSPKEQLASLVKGGSNAKGYTLTEYINDINRENTEVLAEYGADEKVRQAYTYGESGIGERISVDKSTESSYYLYDGRNSVTGILTENANLTNSYQYDPYGNLTSGTADGVNYYGYNGESTNVKTGLQYLRARYYNAENGTFTTEDSDLGTTENPLTRNRYAYTSNNPVNYDDPTGHSWWKKAVSAVKNVGKKIVNTAKKVVKTVVNTVKKVARTVTNAVKRTAKTVINAVTHTKTYQSVKNRVTSSGTYQKIVSKGSNFIRNVGSGLQKAGKTYTSFQSYVAERRAEIRAEVVRQMCTTADRISDQLGKVDWKKVGIAVVATGAAIGVGVLTGGVGIAAVGALGLTEGTLGAAIVGGAVTGAIGGATYSGVSSGLSGNSLKQVAKDTLTGGLMGALTGGAMGGLAYGADKAIGTVKNVIKGSSSSTTSPGHITEMAKKDLTERDFQKGQLLSKNKPSESASNKIFTSTEYKGTVKVNNEVRDVSRKVYQRNDIDINFVDENGLTNLERMQAGKAPYGPDGKKIQLHHVLQEEPGPMAEVTETTHQNYYKTLHGLKGKGESFRNDPVLEKQYNNFRRQYWKWRAEQIVGGQ
ncbi:HNH/ENDO VII family nuclease [Mediterraneibacter faecis]|uniref:HNH/ENDO VII family nuclease n=1 Tax=Mediterraneibacter faecis TaxID=592978 RepID=UPI001D070A4E|nr:HNH/ENDO VII family nuclease [Mediterraneibacter faecis]MCB7288412.1 hypothetical protein [Mediterraneibacter faecis]